MAMQRNPVLPYVLATGALVAAFAFLWSVFGGTDDTRGDPGGVAMREETDVSEGATAARGYGLLKLVNESGTEITFRLVGPEYRDSRTLEVPAWKDRVATGLAPGAWIVKYCANSQCAELSRPIDYEEIVPDGNLHYDAAVIRFGPSPSEWPAARPITHQDFSSD